MFKTAELGQKIAKNDYHEKLPELRARLVQTQYRMRTAKFSAVILVSGNDSIGRHDIVTTLFEWMDPRYLETRSFGDPTDEERDRPLFWRYWRVLPAHGRTTVFYGSWIRRPLMDRLDKIINDEGLDAAIRRINIFERTLAHDGTLLLKFWLHLPAKELRKRLKSLEKDPDAASKISEHDRVIAEHYDRAQRIFTRFVRKTSIPEAPWTIVESTDHRYRNVVIGQTILDAFNRGLETLEASGRQEEAPAAPPKVRVAVPAASDGEVRSILDTLDLSRDLEREAYREQLGRYQNKLFALQTRAFQQGNTSVLVFEGWDASGKGGVIRRLIRGMDPRDYRVVPIGTPTEEELAHHHLWRFWRELPRQGHVRIFDRSWYGRVLVERVEGFATEEEWRRAYSEINDFEEELIEHGILLLKFWMHIDRSEQLRRFKERQATPFKRHKISEEDYRNREQWDAYETAVDEMVQRTSTEYAPWYLVEGNDKRYARVKVIRTVVERLEERLAK